jgi:hypothetical protein
MNEDQFKVLIKNDNNMKRTAKKKGETTQ